jgi:hypothetical protein
MPGAVQGKQRSLVAREYDGPPYFRALSSVVDLPEQPRESPRLVIPDDTFATLELAADDPVWVLPLD